MGRIQIAICLIGALLLPGTLHPQEPKFTERVDVVLVEIPVTVVDKAGNSMRGLTAANFQLTDDGKKRNITFFEEIVVAEVQAQQSKGANSGMAAPVNPAARRNFTILFDLSSSPGYVTRARDAAIGFVGKGMQPLDLAAVATFTVEQGVRFLTTFTTDRKLLEATVSNAGQLKALRMGDPLLLFPTDIDAGLATSQGETGSRQQEVKETMEDVSRGTRRSDDENRRVRVSRQLQSFSNFARQLDKLKGDKQVILLSEGFDAKLIQGREQTGSQEAMEDAAAVLSGEVWKVDNDARFGSTEAANDLQQMVNFFKRSNVVLHALDIKGVRTGVDARAGATGSSGTFTGASTESLFLMANGTGGQVFKNTNDLSEGFDRILKQQEVVYVLGFQAPAGGNRNKFHNVKIKLVGAPSGARAHHRAGYYEAGPSSSIEQVLSATEIMMSDIPQEDFTMHVISSPFPVAGSKPQVPVIVEIEGDKLIDGAGKQLSGELMIYAFDETNAVKDFLYQKISLDLSKIGPALKQSGVKYYGTLSLSPGKYAVRTLFRVSETGRSAYQRVDLKVPDFKGAVVLSPFVVEPPGRWIMVKGASRTQTPVGYPFFVGEESFIPSAMPALQPQEEYKVALFTYNVPAENLQLSAKIRDAQGSLHAAKLALKGRTAPEPDGATKLLFSFNPSGLTPGSYALDFSIQHKNATASELFSVPFVVR